MSRFESEQFVVCPEGIDSIPEIKIEPGAILKVAVSSGNRIRLVDRPDGGWYPASYFFRHDPIFEEGDVVVPLEETRRLKKGKRYTITHYDSDHDVQTEETGEQYHAATRFVLADGETRQHRSLVPQFVPGEKAICIHDYSCERSPEHIAAGREYTVTQIEGRFDDHQIWLAERPRGGKYPADWFKKVPAPAGAEGTSAAEEDVGRAVEVTVLGAKILS